MEIDRTYASPNYNDRAFAPYMIVIHYTGRPSCREAIEGWLCNPEKQVSSHYVIDEDGNIYQLVDEDKRAWHAGVSEWEGERDINSASIGIELQNPGEEFGYRSFPEVQIQALLELLKNITKRIEIKFILGHEDVAPERKIDPGPLFDWHWLAENGVPNIHCEKEQ